MQAAGPVVSSGHFLDSWGSGDRHMTSLQKHMKSHPVIQGKLKFRIGNLSIRFKKKTKKKQSILSSVICCLFTSLFAWMVLMWNIPSSLADPTWKSPICSISSQSWMVATATDAAVVMLQYEQPIRTGHFLIKIKNNNRHWRLFKIPNWTSLDTSSMRSLFCYQLDAIGLKKPNWLVTRISIRVARLNPNWIIKQIKD